MGDELAGDALQRVVDELAIRNLLARLHHTIDALRRGEATEAEYDDCWTDDGVWESPSLGTYVGREGHRRRRDEARALALAGGAQIPDAAPDRRGYHMTTTTEVVLDGDTAVCRSKFLYGTGAGTAGEIHQVGTYRDVVHRTPSGWKVHHRLVYP